MPDSESGTDILVLQSGVRIERARELGFTRVAYVGQLIPLSLTAFAGELISVNSMTVLSQVRLTPAALTRRTAWTDGWLRFAKEPLADALAEFNHYHRQPWC